jgi:predicted deacylase
METYKLTGQQSGKKVLIVGGIHGDEHLSFSLLKQLQSEQISAGELSVVPFVNIPGLLKRSHEYPEGDLELNRSFHIPFLQEVKSLVAEVDYVIDIHSHQYTQTINYGVIFHGLGLEPESMKLLSALDTNYFEQVDVLQNIERVKGTLAYYALMHNKPTVIIETTNLDLANYDVINSLKTSILSLMSAETLTEFRPTQVHVVKSETDILVDHLYKNLGDNVEEGDSLFGGWGIKTGNNVEVCTRYKGIVVTLPRKTFISTGYSAYRIAIAGG